MVVLDLIGVDGGKGCDGLIECVTLAQIAAYAYRIAGTGVAASKHPATEASVSDEVISLFSLY